MTSTATPSNAGERADRRAWLGLIALALPCMIVTTDLTVLFLALPQLTADLDPTATQQLWITDIYGFLIAGALILMGALGDRVGRRKVLLVGAAAFGAASVLAALSTSPEMLIAARAIQGLAGATLVPSTMSLVFAMFRDERQRMTAIGIIMSCFMAGAALGPLVGGALLEFFDWHAVFLVNVPVTLLLLAIGPRLLPEFRNPEAGRVDVPSAALLVSGILATIYGIKQSASHGVDTTTLATMAGGVLVLAVFVVRQLRLAEPLLDVRLFASRVFSTALSGNVLAAFAMFGVSFFTTQYLQLIVGLSPLESGLVSLPGIVVMMVCSSVLTPRLATRIRPGYLVAGGLLICVVGFGLIAQLQPGDGIGVLIPVMMLLHIGIAPASTLGSQLIVGAAPVERAGAASGVAQTGSELGGALGIALLGTLGTTIYRDEVTAAIPADTPAQAATAAGESLGGAVHVAGQLPAGVLDAATAAFTQGLHAVAIACGLALLVSAVLSARFLRHIPTTGAAEQAAPEVGEQCEKHEQCEKRERHAVPAVEAA